MAREKVLSIMTAITPHDDMEATHKAQCLRWIESTPDIYRTAKPATPPCHLVVYFPVFDGDHILLVDHINAEKWLPTGGHVELAEDPDLTVRRELYEELGFAARFKNPGPVFLTIAETIGKTAGHIDVTLWYMLEGDRSWPITYDKSEFNGVRWFHRNELSGIRTDPNLPRYMRKLESMGLLE